MKTKIIQYIPALIALLAIGFRYFSNWCIDFVPGCYGSWTSHTSLSFTKPLYFFALPLLLAAFVLIFVPRTVFNSWLRLATWLVPISALIIFVTPVTSNSWMPLYFISREEVAWYLGILFALISLILIIWKQYGYRKSLE